MRPTRGMQTYLNPSIRTHKYTSVRNTSTKLRSMLWVATNGAALSTWPKIIVIHARGLWPRYISYIDTYVGDDLVVESTLRLIRE